MPKHPFQPHSNYIEELCQKREITPKDLLNHLLFNLMSSQLMQSHAIDASDRPETKLIREVALHHRSVAQLGRDPRVEFPSSLLAAIEMCHLVRHMENQWNVEDGKKKGEDLPESYVKKCKIEEALILILRDTRNAVDVKAVESSIRHDQWLEKNPQKPKPEKFAAFERMISECKSQQNHTLIIPAPQILGDNYEEIISNLGKIAAAGLTLQIAKSH